MDKQNKNLSGTNQVNTQNHQNNAPDSEVLDDTHLTAQSLTNLPLVVTDKKNMPVKQENSFLNLIFNVLVPIFTLNKLTDTLGPMRALILALAFPLIYGLYDYFSRRKLNFVSILGLVNVLVTGGLAVLNLSGIWFAVKEAAFPALIGIFVMASAFTKKPFIQSMFLNPQVFNTSLLESQLAIKNTFSQFVLLMKQATFFLSLSFFFSALLNFVLAVKIFTPIETGLSQDEQGAILNGQIAEMTKWGMIVILIPSMIILMGIFYFVITRLTKLTGLKFDELSNSDKKTNNSK